jgi:hypothetical protein
MLQRYQAKNWGNVPSVLTWQQASFFWHLIYIIKQERLDRGNHPSMAAAASQPGKLMGKLSELTGTGEAVATWLYGTPWISCPCECGDWECSAHVLEQLDPSRTTKEQNILILNWLNHRSIYPWNARKRKCSITQNQLMMMHFFLQRKKEVIDFYIWPFVRSPKLWYLQTYHSILSNNNDNGTSSRFPRELLLQETKDLPIN